MLDFYKGKRIFITGHTGFKGSWLSKLLILAGARVTGYALNAPPGPNLYDLSGAARDMESVIGDIRDRTALMEAFRRCDPEIVIHMAAQPLVRESYREPAYTYETNVMGTVNLLECLRAGSRVRSFVNVTTDKVYENAENGRGFTENDRLDGYDPYSNSKSCSELVTHSYKKSFFASGVPAVSTARAGNVIGGGDFAADRIIPDCVRAAVSGQEIVVRNPSAVRPFQFVLEPLLAYLLIAQAQYEDPSRAGYYNVGPDDGDCIDVGQLATIFCEAWGDGISWTDRSDGGPHEAGLLRLDCTKIKRELGWKPRYDIRRAVEATVEWSKVWASCGDVEACMCRQIREFCGE